VKLDQRVLFFVALLGVLGLFGAVQCSGEREGRLSERIAQEVNARKLSEKQTATEQKRADSLAVVVKKTQESLHVAEKRKEKTRTVYTTLRDSVVITDTVVVKELIEAADSALSASDSVHKIKDAIIGVQSGQIRSLNGVIYGQQQQIDALNRQLRLTVRQGKPPFLHRVASTTTKLAIGAAIGAVAWETIR
jgi:superfamily I DNA and RNA helicase